MYIVSPEVSHLQMELEDVHKEKNHAFVNCGTFLICSLKPWVCGKLKKDIQGIDFPTDEPSHYRGIRVLSCLCVMYLF